MGKKLRVLLFGVLLFVFHLSFANAATFKCFDELASLGSNREQQSDWLHQIRGALASSADINGYPTVILESTGSKAKTNLPRFTFDVIDFIRGRRRKDDYYRIRRDLFTSQFRGEPEANEPNAMAREVLAARYFAMQYVFEDSDNTLTKKNVYQTIGVGLATRRMVYPHEGQNYFGRRSYVQARCPDVIAKNSLTGKISLAEAKGSKFTDAIDQFRDAITALGGLSKIDELVIVVSSLDSRHGKVTPEGFLSRDGERVFGLAMVDGGIKFVQLHHNPKTPQALFNFVPIRFIVAPGMKNEKARR